MTLSAALREPAAVEVVNVTAEDHRAPPQCVGGVAGGVRRQYGHAAHHKRRYDVVGLHKRQVLRARFMLRRTSADTPLRLASVLPAAIERQPRTPPNITNVAPAYDRTRLTPEMQHLERRFAGHHVCLCRQAETEAEREREREGETERQRDRDGDVDRDRMMEVDRDRDRDRMIGFDLIYLLCLSVC